MLLILFLIGCSNISIRKIIKTQIFRCISIEIEINKLFRISLSQSNITNPAQSFGDFGYRFRISR